MRGKKMSVENLQFKINDKLEKRIASLEKELKQSKKTTDVLVLISRLVILFSSLSFILNCIFSMVIFLPLI